MDTLLLDRTRWDLVLDAAGNIARAAAPYALAQDAASAIRLFAGEAWYDTAQGVPYMASILGHAPPAAFMRARFVAAALGVPGVVSAAAYLDNVVDRRLTGQVQIRDASGAVIAAAAF